MSPIAPVLGARTKNFKIKTLGRLAKGQFRHNVKKRLIFHSSVHFKFFTFGLRNFFIVV